MKNSLILFLPLFFIGCVQQNNKMLIQGITPDKFNGEKIYLVPFENATKENVDSVYIQNGKFSFEINVLSEEVKVLRSRRLLRIYMQDLLVIIEPGTLSVTLDSISSASGTEQNILLQSWKEKREDVNRRIGNLDDRLKKNDESEQIVLKQNIQEVQNQYKKYNYEFIKQNWNTTVGQFVYKMMGSSLSSEQQDSLKMLEVNP